MSNDDKSIALDYEFASLYFRARDTNCPSCGYNLRDGTGNICPECGCELAFDIYDKSKSVDSQRVIRTALLFLMLYCVMYVISNIISLVLRILIGTYPETLWSGVLFFGGHLCWFVMLYWTVRLWSRSRKGERFNAGQVLKPAIGIFAITFLSIIGNLYIAITLVMGVL